VSAETQGQYPIPERFLSRTELRFVLDTHLLDDSSPEMVTLRELHEGGWIDLTRTDVMDTELQGAEPDKLGRLLALSGQYVEHLGPAVLDHSRFGHAVFGSEGDGQRLDAVFAILFPGADRKKCRPQHLRDAMNVATALRYAATGFVTREKRLLNKGSAIKEQFNGFVLCSPTKCLEISERFVAKHRERLRRLAEDEHGR
jgi:hypothetical protein